MCTVVPIVVVGMSVILLISALCEYVVACVCHELCHNYILRMFGVSE